MLEKMSVKNKVLIIIAIPLLAILIVTFFSINTVNNTYDTMKNSIFDEHFESTTLVLNGDRDMYQALTSLQELVFTKVDDEAHEKLLKSYIDNIAQVEERVSKTASILEKNKAIWTQVKDKSQKTVFDNIAAFETAFNDWRSLSNSMLKTKTSAQGWSEKFDQARENINLVGELIEQSAQTQIAVLEKDKTSMILKIILVDIIAFLLAVVLAIIFLKMVSRSLGNLREAAMKIAEGDLNVEVDVKSRDEIGVVAEVFNTMTNSINEILININTAASQVSTGSKQVSASSQMLSQGSTEQASSIEEITASLEQIAVQTNQNAGNAKQANELSIHAKENAEQGNEQMGKMLKSMEEINKASGNISKIIKVIDEIAFQTNILALNAAVEAARAGQHGKGFAVVAEEVRNLAARSANAARETTEMIEGSVKKVEEGTKIANETASALNNIVVGVAKASGLVAEIAIASNEQATGIAQVNQAVMQVSQVTQTNSATAQESAAASEELSAQAEILKEMVGKFKLKKYKKSTYKDFENLPPNIIKMLENLTDSGDKASFGMNLQNSGIMRRQDVRAKIDLSDKDFGKY
ncbi:MAG: methyl-accepting chemotaxis protein [Clostridia bacterium]|nr:methyl-accepting chemotaxis protein [Clostridia bacterium]